MAQLKMKHMNVDTFEVVDFDFLSLYSNIHISLTDIS